MPDWTRTKAMLTMTSPLGADVLIPVSLSTHEAISTPFLFNVEAVCQQGTVDPNQLLHQPVCVTLQAGGEPLRHFHGIVQSVTSGAPVRGKALSDGFTIYQLTLVPRLWFLSQTVDCRVYEQKSATDIIKAMFTDIGLTDISGPPSATTRPYTVQFNETDLHFATRLMEEEGWFYYFQHTASAHTLVIAKDNTSFAAIPNAKLCIGGAPDASATPVHDFVQASVTVSGQWTLSDYDPENPATKLKSVQPTTLKTGGAATRDSYRWPALSFAAGTVADRSNWQMQAAEAVATVFEGTTRFGGLVPGGTFEIASRPATPLDNKYAVRSVTHEARDDSWMTQNGATVYSSHFSCFLNSVTWREPIATRRPRMDGIHTALVLGPRTGAAADIKMQDGEEVYTDDLGRVKVRFFWDHRGEATGSNAVWARVVQPWAGNGWGAQFTPRVGTEVAVGFVDGDPDRPMVLGGLYNGTAAPIYLKADKTKIGFRTRSSLKGSQGSNFSEFTIDDNKGSELVYFHAEKDYTTEVENDQTLKVDNCRIVTIKKDETVDIQGKQTITVKGDRAVKVSEGNDKFDVDKGNFTTTIGKGNYETKVSTGNLKIGVSMGNIAVKADAGKIEIEAMQSITLKVGSNSMVIDQTGIKLDGTMIKITGVAMAQLASPMTTVKGDGMLTLKGGVVMIN